MSRSRVAVVAAVAAVASAVAGCGGKTVEGGRIRGDQLTIYSSVPLHGASSVSAEAVLEGEELALAQVGNRIGRYHIVFKPLDDSTPQRGSWDPGQTTINARLATLDPTTIGYVGDLNSGASAVAIPVLNRLGIPQVSPGSTAVGLTSSSPGASPGEPDKYYPTRIRTYVRVMPSDTVQANVQVRLQRQSGCRRTYVVDDGEVDGEEMATAFQLAARATGMKVVGVQSFERNAADYAPFAASIAQSGADCVLISALTESGAVPVTRAIAAAMPAASIFASDELAESSYVDPAQGGLPESLDSRVVVTAPAPAPAATNTAARNFYAAYGRVYGDPEPSAVYGYEAMSLLLGAISRATHGGRRAAKRSEVLEALFGTRDRRSALGTYSIEPSGDTTIRSYGVWRIAGGRLMLWKRLNG